MIGYTHVYPYDVTRDRFGNLYIVGVTNFQDFSIGNVTIPFNGSFLKSAFILKFDKQHNLQWGRPLRGAVASAIEMDHDDNLIISGGYYGETDSFDCFTLTNSSDRSEGFIMKLDSQGTVIWATQTHGFNYEAIQSVTITPTNSIVVTGVYEGNDVTFQNESLTYFGGIDSFIATISSQGILEWIVPIGDPGNTRSNDEDFMSIPAVDSDGNIIVTGFFASSKLQIENFVIPSQSLETYFVAKLNKSGTVMWAKSNTSISENSGVGVGIDSSNEIYVLIQFTNTTKFDQLTFVSNGLDDILIVKYNANGDVIGGKSFGGDSYDEANRLIINTNDDIVIGGRIVSEEFTMDSFTVLRDSTADGFIATLDHELKTRCFINTTGDGYKGMVNFKIDKLNNIMAIAENHDGTIDFGGKFSYYAPYIDEMPYVIVLLGNNQSYDTEEEYKLIVNLGEDKTITCTDDKVVLSAGNWCSAEYLWSDGSHGNTLEVTQAGLYWIEVKLNGLIGKDSIYINQESVPLSVDLGTDRKICKDAQVSFNVTQADQANYLWNDGDINSIKTIHSAGTYWIKISNTCNTVYDSVKIEMVMPLQEVELGETKALCANEDYVLDASMPGATQYKWSNGSNSPMITVMSSGNYEVVVSNGCDTKIGNVQIEFMSVDRNVIPNVITADGNGLNDIFYLPEYLLGSQLNIYNRWGKSVFSSSNYQNTWNGSGLSSGIFYYTLRGKCMEEIKGSIHLITD